VHFIANRPKPVSAAFVIAFISGTMLVFAQYTTQMVQNGNFESDMTGWSFVAHGGRGSARLTDDSPLNDKSPHSLRLEVIELGDGCGVANAGYEGMKVQKDRYYDATFFARKADGVGVGLVFSLETADGKKVCARTTLPEIGRGGIGEQVEGNNQWRKYTVSFHAYESDPKCRLVISPVEPAILYLDEVSLAPRDFQPGDPSRRIDR
jgi:hypothetical protein